MPTFVVVVVEGGGGRWVRFRANILGLGLLLAIAAHLLVALPFLIFPFFPDEALAYFNGSGVLRRRERRLERLPGRAGETERGLGKVKNMGTGLREERGLHVLSVFLCVCARSDFMVGVSVSHLGTATDIRSTNLSCCVRPCRTRGRPAWNSQAPLNGSRRASERRNGGRRH